MTSKPRLKLTLLKNVPLFSHIKSRDLLELATLFHDINYFPQDIIVKEGEVVDSIFIIVSGKAEVSTINQPSNISHDNHIVAVLHEGEVLGLDDTGFYSRTGLRTATVMAITPLHALRLDLSDWKIFLDTHPNITPHLNQAIHDRMRQIFLKKIEPFANVSLQTLQNISASIIDLTIPANTILFNQGDIADCCYLIVEGQIEVIIAKKNDVNKVVIELNEGALFGELALLSNGKRNATVKTKTSCKLLQLTSSGFQLLVTTTSGTYHTLMNMMMNRFRPEQVSGVTVHSRNNAENQLIYILKNATQGTYFKLSEESLLVWKLLDGDHTVQEIALEFFEQFHQIALKEICQLILSLMEGGLVENPKLAHYIDHAEPPKWLRMLAALKNIMEYEYSIKNVDAWITRLYKKVGYLFFTKTAHIIMVVLACTGFIAFALFFHQAAETLNMTPNAWVLLLFIGPANILTVPLHELAHALTTKAYGFQVHRLGIGWFWLGPMAFADTTDMWLADRGKRIVVNLAGVYVNAIIAGILALIAWFLPYPVIAVFLWLVAFSGYLMIFYNLNPSFELDGYYVLMDALDKSNLRTKAMCWLIQDSKKTFTSLKLIKKFQAEIIYWITSISFIFIAAFVAYLVQVYIFNSILPHKIGNFTPSHYRWPFTVLVLFISFASLYGKFKVAAYRYSKRSSG